MALAEIDRVLAVGVRFRAVLADAGYGLSAPFRQGLSERGLAWAVGIPRHQKVYPAGVGLIFPVAGRGRPRQHRIPDALAAANKARWVCEQAHQRLKEEPGLDDFEGRSWTGLHRHALMAMLALAFLQHRRLVEAARGKRMGRTTAPAQPACRAGHPRRPPAPRPNTAAMSAPPQMDQRAAKPDLLKSCWGGS